MNQGQIQYQVVINTNGLQQQLNNTNQQISSAGTQGAAGFSAKFGAIAGITQSIFNKVTDSVSGSIGDAVKRVDQLNAFPRVLQSMGFSADEANTATDKLSKKLQGLPTSLDQGTAGVQRFITAGLGVNDATDTFLAVNNAIIAAGGGAAQSESAMLQFTQALSRGQIEGQEWNSLVSTMPTAFKGLQEASGKTLDELEKLYKTNPEQLQKDLVMLNQEGGGSLESLEKQARNATGGIGTGIENMHTAITRGLASIIESIGQENISNAIASIGSAFETALKAIVPVIQFIASNKDIFTPIAIGIGAIVAAMAAWNIIVGIATAVQTVYNAVLAANPIGIILLAIIGVTAALIYFFTQTELGKQVWENIGKFIGTVIDGIVGFFSAAWEVIKGVWSAITGFFDGLFKAVGAVIQLYIDIYVLAFTMAWDAIKTVWNAVVGFFTGVWNGIKTVFSVVGNWFKGIFEGAWNFIKSAFSGVTGFFQGVWDSIVNIFKGIGQAVGGAVGGAVKGAINGALTIAENTVNGFIDLINGAIGLINKIPGVSLGKIGRISLPKLAEGGIVDSPTTAIIGEAGKEAVLPLENNTGWMDDLAAKISGGGGPTTVIVKIGEETIATKVIDLVNDRTRLSGFNAITV